MNHSRKVLCVVALAAVLVLGLAGLTGTSASAQTTAATSQAMAQDIASGNYTQSEEMACAKDPSCYNAVFGTSVTQDTVGTDESFADAQNELAAQGVTLDPAKSSSCPSGSGSYFTARYWTQKGVFGNVNYRWHWMQRFCRNNTKDKITKWLDHHSWLTDAKSYIDLKEVVDTQCTPGCGSSPFAVLTGTAYRQQHVVAALFTQVVGANFYPWGKFWVQGDGIPTGVKGSAR